MITEKRCSKCGLTKSLTEFRIRKDRVGKHTSWCKLCYAQYDIEHKEERAEYQKKNNQTPERKAYMKKYRQDHLDKITARERKYSEEKKDAKRAYDIAYNEKNKDKKRAQYFDWYKREGAKEIIKRCFHNRRARIKNAQGTIKRGEWLELCEKFGNQCLRCGARGVKLTLDHIVPLSKGGSNTIDNAQPLCKSCNSRKHTSIIDYRPRREAVYG
jgi:5-methylcytosine-specific restriction endonuclease McrA